MLYFFTYLLYIRLATYQLLELLYKKRVIENTNKTVPKVTLLKTLRKNFQIDWFYKNNVFWLQDRIVLSNLILTRWGICFNFNMHPMEALLNNKTWVVFKKSNSFLNVNSTECLKISSLPPQFEKKRQKRRQKHLLFPGKHQTVGMVSVSSNGIPKITNTTTGIPYSPEMAIESSSTIQTNCLSERADIFSTSSLSGSNPR